jgi:hypothetical protein
MAYPKGQHLLAFFYRLLSLLPICTLKQASGKLWTYHGAAFILESSHSSGLFTEHAVPVDGWSGVMAPP